MAQVDAAFEQQVLDVFAVSTNGTDLRL